MKLVNFQGKPVGDINGSRNDDDLTSVPSPGNIEYGPGHTYPRDVDELNINTSANSFLLNFSSRDETDAQREIIDILFTTTIQDDPVADGLVFTNLANQAQQNTSNQTIDQDALVQINLRQPDVSVAKNVVSASNDNPDAVEAGDTVTFSITLNNTGSSEKGAFDVNIKDSLPSGFKIPDSGINLQVAYGDGTGDGTTLDSSSDYTGDLFTDGITLTDDPGSTDSQTDDLGALEGNNNPDRNTVTLTYELEVTENLSNIYSGNSSNIENTATVTYANVEAGTSFPEEQDNATVTVATPQADKLFIATSEPSTDDSNVTIGEVVRYRLIAELPEGQTENLILRDNLPNGLTFLNDSTAQYAFLSDTTFVVNEPNGSTIDLKGGLGIIPVNAGATPEAVNSLINFKALGDQNVGSDDSLTQDNDIYPSGGEVYFKLASLNNVDRDSNSEYALVEFNALVDNNTANNVGEDLLNSVSVLSYSSNEQLVEHDTSDSIPVNVVEPQIAVDKQVEDPDSPGTFVDTSTTSFVEADTGDKITYQVTFTNANGVNNTDAFDVILKDNLPSGLDFTSIDKITWNDGTTSGEATGVALNAPINAGEMTITNNSNSADDDVDVAIDVDRMPKNAEIIVTYSANITSSINPEQLLVNTADVTYTSLPGDGTPTTDSNNSTGSNTPQRATTDQFGEVNSGDPQGERNGSNGVDGEPNDYAATDDGHVKAPPIEPIKTIVSTSEASTAETDDGSSNTNARDVTIGEIVRYQLQADIPEGVVPDFTMTDLLPDGLRYLNDGTTNVTFCRSELHLTILL